MQSRRYDRAYFDKWYRDPAHRISTPALTRRKCAVAVSVAEYYLERPIRSVLDVGCGEGQWRMALARLRPDASYTGVDASEYAVGRFGRRRNLKLGSFTSLHELDLAPSYDLIVCSDLLYYLPDAALSPGLRTIVSLLEGIAFLEAYPTDIDLVGDTKGIARRNAAFYRKLFRRHGLVSCGTHCYAGPSLAEYVTALERGGN